ncbi:3-oxoacyl-[acyl-carrier-protein] synthase III C-terminal domain-containing protein [Yoonia sp. GPGPB17]|uniref:3-oxoacyl-[acyl-carrier-protein] synthase III C-terminal domain-containing protein n=1 Tax=Yoonia sp. GPGPB17 TaxID=3026147 RepID=UPI0030BD19BB
MEIVGIGSYLPQELLQSTQCDDRFGWPTGHVAALTGVRARHVCDDSENQIAMGVAAAKAALADAGVDARDIGLIIGAAAVPYQPIPATAPAYQAGLGIGDGAAFAFDVNATCLGFVTALDMVENMLVRGGHTHALIVSSEVASRALPWADHPEIAGLFGDGAAAVVVTAGPTPLVTAFETHPSGFDKCGIGAGGTRFDFRADAAQFAAHSLFDMDGKALFRLSATVFVPFVDRLLAKAGWTKDDVDLVVPHQASPAALQHMIRQCGFDAERVVDICADVGNQIAASIPFALATAKERLSPGTKVLMLGTSAGVSFGGAAVTF